MQFDTIHFLSDAEVADVAAERMREVADTQFLLQIFADAIDEFARAGRQLNRAEKIVAALREAYYRGCSDGLRIYDKALRDLQTEESADG